MGRKRQVKEMTARKAAPDARPLRPRQIETLISGLVEALPVLDRKKLAAAVNEVNERPRLSLHYLFERFASGDPATRAMLCRVLAACPGADVVDNLNALIFDAGQDSWIKVLANDLLGELGSAVDPDVFGMTVPEAGELEKKLPSRALRLLAEGEVAGAVEHARSLHPAERFLVIYAAASGEKERAIRFLEALARDGEENAIAAVSAIGAEKLAAGVVLLQELQSTGTRPLQKLIRKTLFELRKAGVAVPEDKRLPATAPTEVTDEELPLYRAVMSGPTPGGVLVVIAARIRPSGRLKVFSVVVDLWKRGIRHAAFRIDMSKSSFERFLSSQSGTSPPLEEATIEKCRRVVARGVCVARKFGSPLPFDFGIGRSLLGNLGGDIAAIENPFTCSLCGKPLDAETVEKICTAAPYDNIPVETRCVECRAE